MERTERLRRGEYYWHELVGVTVFDGDGRNLGRVVEVYRAGGAEVISIDAEGRRYDVPLVKRVVRSMAPRRGRIVVDPVAAGIVPGQPQSRSDEPRRRTGRPPRTANAADR